VFAGWKFELRRVDELVCVPQHREHERVVDHLERGEMLGFADDDLRDTDARRFLERIAQQRVRVL
jgi:hypothetical protein